MKESTLNEKVKKWINSLPGGWAYKRLGSYGNRGMPDISGAIHGIRIEIEGKLPGNRPTPKQQHTIDTLAKADIITGWYTSLEEAQQLVIKQAAKRGIHISIN